MKDEDDMVRLLDVCHRRAGRHVTVASAAVAAVLWLFDRSCVAGSRLIGFASRFYSC